MRNVNLFTLALIGLIFTGSCLWAQQAREALAATPTVAQTTTAPLEERIAAAQSVKVIDSILGIALGSDLDEAHEKLDPLSAPGKPPKSEGGDKGEKGQEEKDVDAGEKTPSGVTPDAHAKAKSDADENEGHKVLWQLAETDYSAVYITADDKECITSVTGILRPGKEMPFGQVGEVAKAPVHDSRAVVWDVLRPNQPLWRVLAKGADGKASTLTLFVAGRKSSVALPAVAESEGKAD